MSHLKINGGKKLSGKIKPSGNKNSVLPMLCATLLTDETITIKNVPTLLDVQKLVKTLKKIGSEIKWNKKNCTIKINNSKIDKKLFADDFPIDMRGSILLFAPLLHRMKKLQINNKIKGCSLGVREIDSHLSILKPLGTKIVADRKKIVLSIPERFQGGEAWYDYMSVTTTENFIMGAVLAEGKSKITNAASEPHVQNLCEMLIQMGAKIKGIGTSVLEIEGVDKLTGTECEVLSDHHEITTLLALGAMTGGEVKVENATPQNFTLINRSFEKLGVNISYKEDTAIVKENQVLEINQPYTQNMLPKIEAAPWPYFPVDLLPLMIALSVRAKKGSIMFWNKVYESGLLWYPQMNKFGAHIVMCDPHRIIVYGGKILRPAIVSSPNIIRVAVGLTMVGLAIEGESIVKNAESIKRAHPNFVEKLKSLGADIEWME